MKCAARQGHASSEYEPMTDLTWIESGGGPLVLMAEGACVHWRGQQPSHELPETTDYARACSVQGDVGVIALGGAQVVVMGDEPDRTALLPRSGGLLILRWRWAPSEQTLLSALMGEIDRMAFDEPVAFRTRPGRHVMFDSACKGREPGACLVVDLDADHYAIGTAVFEPDPGICVLVHRLRPQQSA